MAKIESVQFTIPITGLQYTDARPVISGESWDDIRSAAREIAQSVGNEKLAERLGGNKDGEIIGDGVLFNKEEHTYSKDGLPYLSGSTFAHMFEKEFPRDAIAQKVATRDDKEVDDVLAGWDSKGEISLQYGTLVHKCIETWCQYGELPNNEYLQAIVHDWSEVFGNETVDSNELFVQDDAHQLCGVIDGIGGGTIYDWKTGDIHQKLNHTLGKDFPNDRLSLYTLQLNFYKYIVEQNGGKVKKLIIGWLNGEHWEKVNVPIIDIKPYLEQVWTPKKLTK